MRLLNEQALEDIAAGAPVLATGGGGDPYIGKLGALEAVRVHGEPTLITFDELKPDDLVVTAFFMGSPMTCLEKLPLGVEFDEAYDAMQEEVQGRISAIMPIEIGGLESMVPIVLATRRGLPIVDGDLMLRAMPELGLVTATIFGIKANPFVLADERGNIVRFDSVDNMWAERLGRVVTAEMGAVAAGLTYAMTPAQVRECGVPDSVSYAESIGRRVREARLLKTDPIAAILEVTKGTILLSGKVVDVQRRIERAWTVGEAVIHGLDEWSNSELMIRFQNENLIAVRNGDVVATVPDLITVIDAETGVAMTTEDLRYGFRVVVLAIPCAPIWRTAAGIALAGPRHFGYDIDYVPFQTRLERLAG